MNARSKLRGKTVLVSGAARGVGAAAARQLVAAGARVALLGIEPERTRELLRELGSAASFYEADVTDREAVQRAVDRAVSELGGFDLVLSNAGIAGFGTLATFDPAQFERTIAVNLIGTWNVIRATLPQLIARRGYILLNASIAAGLSAPGMGAYSASKAGTESLGDTLRTEVAHRGVGVGVAYMSWIATDLVSRAAEHPGFIHLRKHLPIFLRSTATPEHAAAALLDGLARRRARVFVPKAVQLLLGLRWAIARSGPYEMSAMMPEMDRLCETTSDQLGSARTPFSDPTFQPSR